MRDIHDAAGKHLRKFLWMSYLTGSAVDASFLGHLAWHIRESGGRGVDEFAVNPNSNMGHAKIKLLLGREFEDPELHYVTTALHDKKNDQRIETKIPIRLPSSILSRSFKDFQEPASSHEPIPDTARFDCVKWHEHTVKRRADAANVHWSRIVPASLYWDGVEITNRDNFFTICLRDLRSNVSTAMIILRRHLSYDTNLATSPKDCSTRPPREQK